MYANVDPTARKLGKANAFSVIRKLLIGTMVIMIVGVCAYLCLIVLMRLI